MARLSFESAETLVYDPVSANRAATRAALYNLGFRRIETVASLEALPSAFVAARRISPCARRKGPKPNSAP